MTINTRKIPRRYLPKNISKKDYKKQLQNIQKTRKQYLQHKYVDRPQLKTFHSKKSPHVQTAKKMYKVDAIKASPELARKTKCSISALRKIVKKGRGAYCSSGSRPNQTADSWAFARLASSLTGGNSSKVDYSILKDGCDKNSPALILAEKRMKE
jgi:hypothetical protein